MNTLTQTYTHYIYIYYFSPYDKQETGRTVNKSNQSQKVKPANINKVFIHINNLENCFVLYSLVIKYHDRKSTNN